jgi:sugar/nucleoside kinase (ribokinase family)
MRVLCVGMMVCDVSLFPVSSQIFKMDTCRIEPPVFSTGGDALNVAVGLARLGLSVSIAGRIGGDVNGVFVRERASAAGVDVSAVIVDESCPTAVSYVLIEASGERHFLASNAIFGRVVAADVPAGKIAESEIVYLGSAMAMALMDSGGTEKLFSVARSLGKTTVLDAAVAGEEGVVWMARLEGALRNTDYFLPSYEEARAITGRDEPSEMARVLRPFGFKALAIKLGKRGCYVTDFRRECLITPLADSPVKDTTGAGDSFVAGFIRGLARGWDAFECATFANVVASRKVGAVGATNGIPDFESAKTLFEAHGRGMKREERAFEINSSNKETQ